MSATFQKIEAGVLPKLPISRRIRNRLRHRDKSHYNRLRDATRKMLFENLEQRVLLSADAIGYSPTLVDDQTANAGGQNITVIVEEDSSNGNKQQIRIIDSVNGTQTTVAAGLTFTEDFVINTGAGDDIINFDFSGFTGNPADFGIVINGGDGTDTITITGFDAGFDGFLNFTAEQITLNAGVNIAGVTDVTFAANDTQIALDGSTTTQNALVTLNAGIAASGKIDISSTVSSTGTKTLGAFGGIDFDVDAVSKIILADGISLIAGTGLDLVAATSVDITANSSTGLPVGIISNIAVNVEAGVAVGEGVTLSTSTSDVLVNAVGVVAVAVDLTSDDDLLTNVGEVLTAGLGLIVSDIDIDRDTYITFDADTLGTNSTVTALTGAVNMFATSGGEISNEVRSVLIGAVSNEFTKDSSRIALSDVDVMSGGASNLMALNNSVVTGTSRYSFNTVGASETSVRMNGGSIASGSTVVLSANDIAKYIATATSGSETVSPVALTGFNVKLIAGVNQINRSVSAIVENGAEISGTIVTVEAANNMILSANTEAMSLDQIAIAVSSFEMSIAGILAFNELNGDIIASVSGSDIVATGQDTDGQSVIVSAVNSALMNVESDAMAESVGGGTVVSGAFSIALNMMGYSVDDVGAGFLSGIDTILGTDFADGSSPVKAHAFLSDTVVDAVAAVIVVASNSTILNATVSNAAKVKARTDQLTFTIDNANKKAIGASFLLANNRVLSEATAEILNSTRTVNTVTGIDAGGKVSVTSTDTAIIHANNAVSSEAIATSSGRLNLIDDAIGFVSPSNFTFDDATTGSRAMSFDDRIGVAGDYSGTAGTPSSVYTYLGANSTTVTWATVDFNNKDLWKEVLETSIVPRDFNFEKTDAVAFGGTVVRNLVDSEAKSRIDMSTVAAEAGIDVIATENAQLTSIGDLSVNASSGSSVDGSGMSLAVGGALIVNTALANATAEVTSSTLEADSDQDDMGALIVRATNNVLLDATLHSAISGGADAIGIIIAFNTLGYAPTNLLFQTIDALIGTDIGPTDDANATARIVESTITNSAGVTVEAINAANLKAQIDSNATAAAAAFHSASASAMSGTLSSNMMSGSAIAYIEGGSVTTTSAAGSVSVTANDLVVMASTTAMTTTTSKTNDLGIGMINGLANTLLDDYKYTSKSGTHNLEFGDLVYMASDIATTHSTIAAESMYQYLGTATTGAATDLGVVGTDYSDANYWKLVSASNIIPKSLAGILTKGLGIGSSATSDSKYAMITRNEAAGGATAFIKSATVVSAGSIAITARERTSLTALDSSTVTAKSSGSKGSGGMIATNNLLSKATGYSQNSVLNAQSVDIDAFSVATMDATTSSTMTASSEAVNIMVAFNTMGLDSSNIFFQATDAILGSDYLIGERPVGAEAYADNSDLDASGSINVRADTREKLIGSLTSVTADMLDDAGVAETDDADILADAAILAFLEAEIAPVLATQNVVLEGPLTVEIVAQGVQWYVTDTNGVTYQILKIGPDLVLNQSNLMDAFAGTSTTAAAKNERGFFDMAVAAQKDAVTAAKEKSEPKKLSELKYGANSQAAGGLLATNRVYSETKAWIGQTGQAPSATIDVVGELLKGSLVEHDDTIYEYIGDDLARESQFDFTSRTTRDTLATGDRILLHKDIGTFVQGDIIEFKGASVAGLDDGNSLTDSSLAKALEVGTLLLAGDFTVVNPELVISLSVGTQVYVTNTAEWREFVVQTADVTAGTDINVTAVDTANLRADMSASIESSATNNMNAFISIAANAVKTDIDFTTNSGSRLINSGDSVLIATDTMTTSLDADKNRVYLFDLPDTLPVGYLPSAAVDMGALYADAGANLDDINNINGVFWTDITTVENADDILSGLNNLGNLADSNSKAYGGMIVTNDVRSEAVAMVDGVDLTTTTGDITVAADSRGTMLATMDMSSKFVWWFRLGLW